jgi:hypothetical protein
MGSPMVTSPASFQAGHGRIQQMSKDRAIGRGTH